MTERLLVGEDIEKEYRVGPELVRVLRGATVAVGAGEVVALSAPPASAVDAAPLLGTRSADAGR